MRDDSQTGPPTRRPRFTLGAFAGAVPKRDSAFSAKSAPLQNPLERTIREGQGPNQAALFPPIFFSPGQLGQASDAK